MHTGSDRIDYRLTLIAIIAALTVLAGLVIWLDPWIETGWPAMRILLNVWPAVLLFACFLGLTRRVLLALILAAGAIALLFHINGIKLEQLNQPLLLTDFLLFGQVATNIDLFGHYIHPAVLLGGALGLIVIASFAAWLERPRISWRSALPTAMVAALLILSFSLPAINNFYSTRNAPDTPWQPMTAIRHTGLLASLAASAGTDLARLPATDPGALASLRATLDAHAPLGETRERVQLPDIVIILSESFFEPGLLNHVDECATLPQWCELREAGINGSLATPTFAGNTTRTEFEVLTGIPYVTLPEGVYPYMSVITRPFASIPWWLRHIGYRTVAVHGHDGTFWQRRRALPLLGFDEFIAKEDFESITHVGYYVSDADMTDQVLMQLNNDSPGPAYVFAISMENHGPWHGARPHLDADRLAAIPVPEPLDEQGAFAWRQYIYHARNALIELNRMHARILERDQPTLLLFFGDHLPGLQTSFSQLGFRDSRPIDQQPVPFLLLSNYVPNLPDWLPESTHALSGWLLEISGLPLPEAYRDLIRALRLVHGGDSRAASIGNHINALYAELLHLDPRHWQAEAGRLAIDGY